MGGSIKNNQVLWLRRSSELAILLTVGIATAVLLPMADSIALDSPIVIGSGITLAIVAMLYVVHRGRHNLSVDAAYITLAGAVIALLVFERGDQTTFIALLPFLMLTVAAAGTSRFITSIIIAAAVGSVGWAYQLIDIQTLLYIATALIAGFILSRVTKLQTSQRFERKPEYYKKPSNELMRLVDESGGLLRALGDGVIVLDGRGVIHFVNPTAEKILGWRSVDTVKLQFESIFNILNEDGSEITKLNHPVKQSLNLNQEVRSSALQLLTKNLKKLFISITVSPLGEAGSGVIIIFRDVTKERSEEREQAEFISTASHEMRTPVASIEGYLGLTLNPSTAQIDDRARDYINKAHEAAQHLGRLFQDLLDVSKSEDGRLSNHPEAFDVVKYTSEVVESLQSKASEKGLTLLFKPLSHERANKELTLTPIIYGELDRSHFRELIANLIENAIKYTPSGGVEVDIKGGDKTFEVSIQDSGVGIPEEDIPHLFQKFYRVDNTDTREIGGTGLGLYLARRLAETMGGKIWATSKYKSGSTFYIELPRIDSLKAQDLIRQQSAASSKPHQELSTTPTAGDSDLAISTPNSPASMPMQPPPAIATAPPSTAESPVAISAESPMISESPNPQQPTKPSPPVNPTVKTAPQSAQVNQTPVAAYAPETLQPQAASSVPVATGPLTGRGTPAVTRHSELPRAARSINYRQ